MIKISIPFRAGSLSHARGGYNAGKTGLPGAAIRELRKKRRAGMNRIRQDTGYTGAGTAGGARRDALTRGSSGS